MAESVNDFNVGMRVELHPATNAWMQGDRVGRVVRLGALYVHVKMDRSGRVRTFAPKNVIPL